MNFAAIPSLEGCHVVAGYVLLIFNFIGGSQFLILDS